MIDGMTERTTGSDLENYTAQRGWKTANSIMGGIMCTIRSTQHTR